VKPRYAKNFARAVSLIRSEISEDACAEAVGRSNSLVRKWADPDNPAVPNLEQALALDLLYAKSVGKKPPILDIYTDKLTDVLNGRKKLTVNLMIATLSVQSVVGQLSDAVANASNSVGGSGAQLSNYNRATILGLVDKLQEISDLIEDAVE
jgi:hypothetical protein